MMQTASPKFVRTCALRTPTRPAKQRGVVLLIALIALVALTLAGIALVRSIDTGNVIAGNLAFKQAALQVSDTGVEAAVAALPNIVSGSLDTDIPGQYFATIQPVDANGIPTTINWNTSVTPATNVGGYSVQYVIDRLCQGPLPVTDIQNSCVADAPLGGGSHKANAPVFSSSAVVYYRVTVRVTGPRNAVSMVQVIVSD
jgi:type IV pilus assembly protein PilX